MTPEKEAAWMELLARENRPFGIPPLAQELDLDPQEHHEQLYSMSLNGSNGHGDVADLADLFVTAKELAEMVPEQTNWIVEPFGGPGFTTELAGKVKEAGKTTFMLAMASCVVRGRPFLGRPTKKMPVVYLSEQSAETIRPALERAGLSGSEDFYLLTKDRMMGLSWNGRLDAAIAKCEQIGSQMLVIDTIAKLANIADENISGEWSRVLETLDHARDRKLWVVTVRHAGKGRGRSVVDTGRGHSSVQGNVDVIAVLSRTDGAGRRQRKIEIEGRFGDHRIDVELTDDHRYRAVIRGDEVEDRIVTLLTKRPMNEHELLVWLKQEGVSRMTLRRTLDKLLDDEKIEQTGEGVKGNPYVYEIKDGGDGSAQIQRDS